MTSYEQPARSDLRRIDFSRYVIIVMIFFGFVGLLFGLIGFAGSLIGGNVFFRFGSFYISGISAGILGIPLMPILFALAGGIVGLASYHPINWVYRHL